jgi:small subunit ribosomal protein S2
MANIPTIEEMLKAGMHFGHRTSKWHPKAANYIFGERNGVHIIDLVKARKMLEDALGFMKKSVKEGKVILFVGTKTQAKARIKNMAVELDMPYVSEKWLGGCLTNFTIIRKSIKKYNDLSEKKQTGKLDKYTKKERLEIDRDIARLEIKVGGLAKLIKAPDIIFIWDIKTEKTALTEAQSKGVVIVAVCDTNVNPEAVDYVIPANDDASKTIKLILGTIKETIEEGKKEVKQ